MKFITKKRVVLFLLFILPLIFYLMLSSGINNFAKLPVLTNNVTDVTAINSKVTFSKKISIVCFIGNDIAKAKGKLFNLNQKIYKPFYGFKDFQIVAIYPKGNKNDIIELQKDLGAFTDMGKWKFVEASDREIKIVFNSFKTRGVLHNLGMNKAYIIDKELNLRGRTDDEDTSNGKLFGYNMTSVADLNNKMKDDVKVVLAEYRLALKKNDADREI